MVKTVSIPAPTTDSIVRAVKTRLLWVMLLRGGLITALLGATIGLNYDSAEAFSMPSARFLLGLVIGTYFMTIAYIVWYRLDRAILLLAWVQLVLDLVLWACLVYATGGIASGFTALFDLWVIVWAVVLGGRAAFQSAIVSIVLLCTLAGLLYTRALLPLSDQLEIEISRNNFVYMLGLNMSALILVAALVNSLVSRLERTGQGLQVERTRRADLIQLHADMIRSLTVGIATTDLDRNILTMNPAGMDILGMGPDGVEKAFIDELFPDLQGELLPAKAVRSRGNGVAKGGKGRSIPIEYIIAPLSSANGKHQGYIVVFSDLTEVRRLEAALEKSRRLAALGELAASLAHEIRNPLGAVSGAFQILANNMTLGEEDRSLVEIIKREISRMEQLVTDMLDYSRPRRLEADTVSMTDLVREVVRTFLLDEESRDREVTVEVEESLYSKVDVSQIKQVLWNLLINAQQATEPGDGIAVIAKREGETLRIEVRDTGRGIDEMDLLKVFEPFFTTKERGLGLGLALCRRIVADHQGDISAEIRDGIGTVFGIKLPLTSKRKEMDK